MRAVACAGFTAASPLTRDCERGGRWHSCRWPSCRWQALAAAAKKQSQTEAISAYAKLSLSYDRFLKAGDLYGNSLL